MVTTDIRILRAEVEAADGLLVTFSDGTTAGYVVEELLQLRPSRETIPPFITITTKVRWAPSDQYFPLDLPPAIG